MNYPEQTVVVTGAASGIGLVCAQLFASRGASVALFDIDAARGETALEKLRTLPGESAFYRVDVACELEIRAALAAAAARFGRVTALVNCAAVQIVQSVEDTSIDDIDLLYRVNLRGPFLLSREALPFLAAAGSGAIVNIGSVLGLVGDPMLAAYGAMKGGLIAMTKSLAIAYGPRGVRVNCICPGDVNTPMVKAYFTSSADPDGLLRSVCANYALGRIAEPQEIAEAVCFLASPASSFITGSVLVADGGLTSKCY